MVSTSQHARSAFSHRVPLELKLRKLQPSQWDSLLPHRWDAQTVTAKSLLDHVRIALVDDLEVAEAGMAELFSGLHALRSSSTPEMWKSIVEECVNHPIIEQIHQDPFTARSFHKPRGYAGDAVLIDYIYSGDSQNPSESPISSLGEIIFRFTTGAPASAGVRARRDLMASYIDEACAVIEGPHILSVACGHLREATLCRSVLNDEVGRFIAMDQDELSLEVVKESTAHHGVVPICSSIKSLFRGEVASERFDFIYSTGLYDYLDNRIATRLTSRLFDMLNPGGRLVIANFLPDIWCAAFMETFMGWSLIYRTSGEIDALADNISQEEIASRRTFIERNANIVLLDLRRR